MGLNVIIGTDSLQRPLTGVGRYTFELCRKLVADPQIDQITGFDFGRFHSIENRLEKLARDDSDGGHFEGRQFPTLRSALSKSAMATKIYELYMSRVCERILRGRSGALFHSPNFHLPGKPDHSIITVHDLSFLLHPQYHPRVRLGWMNSMVPAALRDCSHIISVSHSTKSDLVRHFHLDPDSISVTHLGVGESFRPRDFAVIDHTVGALGLRCNGYFLCVATLEPRKNLEGLIAAYLALEPALRKHIPLVLAGGFGWKCRNLRSLVGSLKTEGVIYLGYINEATLPLLYNGARCFVYPSFYEGFGLPVLEAQASGIPVISSDVSSIPEVANCEAILVDPGSRDQITSALRRSLEDDAWSVRCRASGLRKAAEFSWEKCAMATTQVYQMVQSGFAKKP